MKKSLTERQRAVLAFIESHVDTFGRAPTVREIGAHFGIKSTNGVRAHLAALIRKGYLKREDHLSRGLELTRPRPQSVARVPVVGSVPAGNPIDAVENIDDVLAVDGSFLPSDDSFALRVTGDSMKDAGILDGDIVLVRKQAEAQSGDVVVAIINGEATVKRFFPQGSRVRLQPENPAYEPIIVDRGSGEFHLAGKVVGLLRRF